MGMDTAEFVVNIQKNRMPLVHPKARAHKLA